MKLALPLVKTISFEFQLDNTETFLFLTSFWFVIYISFPNLK